MFVQKLIINITHAYYALKFKFCNNILTNNYKHCKLMYLRKDKCNMYTINYYTLYNYMVVQYTKYL